MQKGRSSRSCCPRSAYHARSRVVSYGSCRARELFRRRPACRFTGDDGGGEARSFTSWHRASASRVAVGRRWRVSRRAEGGRRNARGRASQGGRSAGSRHWIAEQRSDAIHVPGRACARTSRPVLAQRPTATGDLRARAARRARRRRAGLSGASRARRRHRSTSRRARPSRGESGNARRRPAFGRSSAPQLPTLPRTARRRVDRDAGFRATRGRAAVEVQRRLLLGVQCDTGSCAATVVRPFGGDVVSGRCGEGSRGTTLPASRADPARHRVLGPTWSFPASGSARTRPPPRPP